MKRFAFFLLLIGGLLAVPKAHAQYGSSYQSCVQGACQGYSAPVGSCNPSGGFVYKDLSASPIASYACVSNAWAQIGGGGGGGATTFDQIGSGTNTGHGLVVGAGSTITPTAGGFVNANELNGTLLSGLATGPLCNTTGTGVPVYCSSSSLATALNTSPSTKLSSQLLPNGLISVAQVGNLWGDWDSYGYGLGPLNPAKFAPFQLVSADVPAPFVNLSGNGATLNQIAAFGFGSYQPSQLGLPDVALIGAGENDTGCASTTAACGYSFKEMKFANILHWLNPPTFSNSIWASSAAKTLTWNPDTGIYGTFNKVAAGTPITSTASGGTLTFTVPSSTATKIYINYVARASNTGTFTATIDGSPLTDEFSATNTFSGAPLSANPTINNGFAVYTQAFAVTPGTSHSVVITATGIIEIARINTNKLGASDPANMVYDYNVIPILGSFATWNPIIAALDASLIADGYLVGPVDLVNGVSTSSTQWSSLNPTYFPQAGVPYTAADFATSATTLCTASQAASHPNECGGLDFYRNFLNAQANLGVIISRVSLGAKYTEQSGNFYVPPSVNSPKFSPTYKDLSFNGANGSNGKCYETYNGANFYNAVCGWQDQSTAGSKPWSQKFMQGPVGGPANNFWWCSGNIAGYSDTTAYSNNQSVTWCDAPQGIAYRTQIVTAPETVTFSATPTFSASTEISRMILTGNVTSSTLAAADDGAHKTIILCQDATGSRTFVPPTNVFGFGTIGTTLSKCNTQSFVYSTLAGYVGWYASGAMIMNE